MKCKCIEKVNKQLANMGVELETRPPALITQDPIPFGC